MTSETRTIIQQASFCMLFCLLLSIEIPFAAAQNDALKKGFDSITEEKVKDTVSFLASDEMAGRDTPSPELKKAAEYVAGRFKKAGLSPGCEDEFFQVHEVATTQLDNDGVKLISGGKEIKHFGLLGASNDPLDYTGKLEIGEPNNRDADYEDTAVLYRPGAVESPADEVQIARMVGQLKRKMAKAVLIEVEPDSRLIATAARNRLPRLINPRAKYTVPTLLVPKLDPEAEYKIEIPKIENDKTKVRNVIGMVRGSDPELSKEAIIISAHLDHIGQQTDLEDPVFNGADDNATGVTAVIAMAEAFAALPKPPKRTVIFMTFWGEERGLLGSRHYVNNPTWPLEEIAANINIEMIGRPEAGARGKCWMTGWDQSTLGTLMKEGAKNAEVEIFEHPRFSAMLYRASDNASFVNKGVIGHSFSAGSLHRDYHQPSDEWEKLEIKHMTKVIKGLFAGSYAVANGDEKPEKTVGQRRRRARN